MILKTNLKSLTDKSYPITIGSIDKIELKSKVAIITNPKVSGLHIKYLLDKISAKELIIVTVKDGEEHKNLKSIEYILDNLSQSKFDRKSTLIAFGGGVIGDITGFCASIFLRGVDFIQIPTTLLSQVDSSIGGKTGVNSDFGKNLIGSFYQPKSVYIDTKFLDTLQDREFNCGVAEIIKKSVMFDKEFFYYLKKNDLRQKKSLKYAIKRSLELKSDVVSKDEKESGLRSVLNYGHTFAHVIEKSTQYKRFLHGEAVSIGINMANTLALKLSLISEENATSIKSLLMKYNLPTEYKIEDIDSFYKSFFLDKKSIGGKIRFILPDEIGSFHIKDDIPKDVVLDALREFS